MTALQKFRKRQNKKTVDRLNDMIYYFNTSVIGGICLWGILILVNV